MKGDNDANSTKVRLDKWLWAARFFKTRSLAKEAVEGGKVRYEGNRVKASKEVQTGVRLLIRQGWDDKDVEVKALVQKRVSAKQAAVLYEETPESLAKRELAEENRKALAGSAPRPENRPSGKQRRQIKAFNRGDSED